MTTIQARVDLADADDALLADRAADGDSRAFAVLVRRHGPRLRAYAVRILGGTAESDDVVQETFITAWQRLPELTDRASLASWLLRIASRKAIDRVRARRQHVDIDDHEAEAPRYDGPEAQSEQQSAKAALDAALTRLPDAQRQAWLLREASGASYDEIAETLRLSTSTVRGLLARARATLMTEMEAWR